MKRFIILLAVITGTATLNTALAQTGNPDTTTLHFIIKASIDGLQEISAGKQAEQKAMRSDVKAFGKRMVTDHSTAQAKLMQIAKARGYQVPPEATSTPVPDPMLAKASGKDFDRLYVHMMAPSHRQAVLLFEDYANKGKDPQVKAFAIQTLPILKQHLASIKAIDSQIKDAAK
jgi:putative membrane protein